MSKNLFVNYYPNNKEKLQKRACERYQNLSREEKEKKATLWSGALQNFSEDEKQKLAEYGTNIIE